MRRRSLPGRSVVLAAIVAGLVALSVTGYHALGFAWTDAVYATLSALLTEGFQTRAPLSPTAELFTAVVSLLGVTVFLGVLGLVGGTLLDWHGSPSLRRRRMHRTIDRLRGHVVLCSYGRVGRAVADELRREGRALVVVEIRPELEADLRAAGLPHVIGDSTSEDVLRRAGLDRAGGLVCAADSDADDVYITLIARAVNPGAAVVARASDDAAAERLRRAGAGRIVSPYTTGGRRMAMLETHPHVVDFLDVARRAGGPVRLEELVVEPGSDLVGRPLSSLDPAGRPLLVRAADGTLRAHPPPSALLAEGDVVILVGGGHGE